VRALQSVTYTLEYTGRVRQHFIIPETQNAKPLALKKLRPITVFG